MKYTIKNRFNAAVLFKGEYKSLKDCVAAAVKARAYLAGANLAGAYLAGAYLAGANLAGANLAGAYLAGAYLAGANLADAYLADAYLAGAYLAGANLADAYLADAYHCRAGWAITLAGEAGKQLESQHGPQRAGAMIYRASTGRVPHFFATTERALEDIKRCAEDAS